MAETERRRCAASAILAVALLFPGAARAEVPANTEQFKRAVAQIIGPVSIVDALAAQCNALSDKGRESRQTAIKAWRAANRIDEFQTAVVPMFARVPNSVALIRVLRDKAAEKAKELTQKTPELCERFDEALSEKALAVGGQVTEIMPLLAAANARLAAGNPSKPPSSTSDLTLYTVVQLSNLAEMAMNAIAPAEAADEKKREGTREKAGKKAVEALGIIAVRGTVTGRDDLREWRGEEQSIYEVSCRAFVDKTAEERFKSLEGKEITVGGKVSNFVTRPLSGGGAVILAKCGFVDDARLTKSNLPESGEMEMRPASAEEANAGPGKGIPMGDVEKVAYKVEVGLSLDGFGNSYQNRDEDTWILLKDGTAYHYRWRIPFTDINVPLLKRRDPANWHRWRLEGKDLHLTATGGRQAGQTKTVSGVSSLMPFPPDTRFERRFKFLHVGMMGVRRERDYIFRRDGTVNIHGSNIVAAQLGPSANIGVTAPGMAYSGGSNSSLVVVGKPNERRVRYRIDGYLLELTGDDGAVERHFLARMGDGSKPDAPNLLYLNGQMLWENDKGDKD